MQMDGWMEGGRDKEKDGTGRELCMGRKRVEDHGRREGWMERGMDGLMNEKMEEKEKDREGRQNCEE